MPDVLPATLVATFVACCSCCIYGTVGAWLPLYPSTEKHWSTAEYSTFYVFWGLVGFLGSALPVGSPTRPVGALVLSRRCTVVFRHSGAAARDWIVVYRVRPSALSAPPAASVSAIRLIRSWERTQ